jgi:hypothetical protein
LQRLTSSARRYEVGVDVLRDRRIAAAFNELAQSDLTATLTEDRTRFAT